MIDKPESGKQYRLTGGKGVNCIASGSTWKESEVKPTRQQWDTAELQRDFTVLGFSMGFVVVVRKSDGQKGSLDFDHMPRVYYDFTPHKD